MKIMLDDGAFMPVRAHEKDAGLDIRAPLCFDLPAHCGVAIDTGVHVEIPSGCAGFLKSKSGLNVKHDIRCEGVIDCGYTGSIVCKLYNDSVYDYHFMRGDKITQLVILPIVLPQLERVECFEETERGDGGFGSTGR